MDIDHRRIFRGWHNLPCYIEEIGAAVYQEMRVRRVSEKSVPFPPRQSTSAGADLRSLAKSNPAPQSAASQVSGYKISFKKFPTTAPKIVCFQHLMTCRINHPNHQPILYPAYLQRLALLYTFKQARGTRPGESGDSLPNFIRNSLTIYLQ